MTSSAEPGLPERLSGVPLRVIFRAPAGARRGFGHLVRCLSLARAMGVRPLLALRGSRRAVDVALALGADVLASHQRTSQLRTLAALRPDVVVVDDPDARQARRWITAARACGAAVVTIHDLGLGCADGDLVIDGSVARRARAARGRALAGTRFAVLDPDLTRFKTAAAGSARRVLIALGGGPHAAIARDIARGIVDADPEAQVRIASGFVTDPPEADGRVRWVASRRGLGPELAHADVAIVGGGVSLYEACAMGIPSVALPVVRAQMPTVEAFARRGAAIALPPRAGAHVAVSAAVRLLNDTRRRAAMARRSTRLVDGRGALRAAAAVALLARLRQGSGGQAERRAS